MFICHAISASCFGLCLADSGSHGVDILEDNDDVLEPGPKIAETAAEADSGLRTPHRELPEVPPDDMEGDHEYLEQDPLG